METACEKAPLEQIVDSDPESIHPWKMTLVGVYYLLCLVLPTTISSWISEWIGQHGWVAFNRCIRTITIVTCVVGLALAVRKLWRKEGTLLGWSLMGITGVVLYLLARHLVVLPSEYIHYPEYAGLFILLFWATQRRLFWSLALTVVAGTFDEAIQAFMPSRVVDINDVLLNAAGGLIGLILTWLIWPIYYGKREL